MKRIILTGGGTAGHVTPNLALIPRLRDEGWDVQYIGTHDGIERELMEKAGVPFHAVAAGKFRRYRDLRNLTDPLNVLKGIWQATGLIRRLKPRVIFSKGGFVAVPVVIGGWLNGVPVAAHESDLTPGLANRISLPFTTRICATFPETLRHLPKGKGVLTGTPIRPELFLGDASEGLRFAGLSNKKPVLMVMGGSLGAARINQVVREALPALLKRFQVAHICGKGKVDDSLAGVDGYRQFEYVSDGLADLLACAEIMVTRAGANFIFELLALKKPNLLIPLPRGASRGDQILNARSFQKQGYSMVLYEEDLSADSLMRSVDDLYGLREQFKAAMEESALKDGVSEVLKVIESIASAK